MPVDTDTIPNWTRWRAKEERGVNRGYTQAYINENNANYRAFISVNDRRYQDERTITSIRQTDAEDSGFTGYDKDRVEHDSIEDAEAALHEWMNNHPCERSDEGRTPAEVLSDLRLALEEEGVVPQHDADITGITGARGSTGFSLRPVHADADEYGASDALITDESEIDDVGSDVRYYVNIPVDGKASGLSFREYTKRENGEVRELHEPRNGSKLVPAIVRALESVGLANPAETRESGHQKHWDYSMSYTSITEVPDDLGADEE